MQKVADKIMKVMASLTSVSKEGFNAFHKYKYVTDTSIVIKIRKELIKNKLICIPHQKSCTVSGELTTLCVSYKIMDVESGEFIETDVFGYGQDKGDKGVYKAATGAEKYFLLKTFLLPTDDDPENEKEPRKRVTKDEIDTFDKSLPPKEVSLFISNPDALTLFKLMKERNIEPEKLRDYLKSWGIEGTNKITKEFYPKVYEWILKQEVVA